MDFTSTEEKKKTYNEVENYATKIFSWYMCLWQLLLKLFYFLHKSMQYA